MILAGSERSNVGIDVRSSLTVPLRGELGHVFAILQLQNKRQGTFSGSDELVVSEAVSGKKVHSNHQYFWFRYTWQPARSRLSWIQVFCHRSVSTSVSAASKTGPPRFCSVLDLCCCASANVVDVPVTHATNALYGSKLL